MSHDDSAAATVSARPWSPGGVDWHGLGRLALVLLVILFFTVSAV